MPQNLRVYCGQEIAFWRKEKGFTQEGLANAVNYSVKSIQGIEQGLRAPTEDLCHRIDTVLGLNGVIARAGALARADNTPWGSFREFEQQASAIYDYEGFVVPGLLQTYEYALAVIKVVSPERDAEEVAADRMARQERLRGENPPALHVIIDESVLDREIGGTEVFREQLERLLDPGPGVTVRILPHGAHPGLAGSIAVLDLPDGDSIAYADSPAAGGLIDTAEGVARCRRMWDELSARALPIDVSADWIRAVLEDFSDEDHRMA